MARTTSTFRNELDSVFQTEFVSVEFEVDSFLKKGTGILATVGQDFITLTPSNGTVTIFALGSAGTISTETLSTTSILLQCVKDISIV